MRALVIVLAVLGMACSPYKRFNVELPQPLEYTWDWPQYDVEKEYRRFSMFIYNTDDYSDTLRGDILVTFGEEILVTTSEGFMQGFWYWGEDTLYDHHERLFLLHRSVDQIRMTSLPDKRFNSHEEYILTNK